IAGPDEGGHRLEVDKAVSAAGLSDTVSFIGPVDGARKRSVYRTADLFVLPTYSENFGIVVAEALAYGVPVLTTTGAPWPALVERKCGWWVDPNIDNIAAGLREATLCEPGILQAMGARGRDWVSTEFNWEGISEKFIILYESVLTGAKSLPFIFG